MNKNQKFLLLVAAILVTTSGLWPPWIKTVLIRTDHAGLYECKERHCLLTPPARTVRTNNEKPLVYIYELDHKQILIEWGLVLIVTGLLVMLAGNSKADAEPQIGNDQCAREESGASRDTLS